MTTHGSILSEIIILRRKRKVIHERTAKRINESFVKTFKFIHKKLRALARKERLPNVMPRNKLIELYSILKQNENLSNWFCTRATTTKAILFLLFI